MQTINDLLQSNELYIAMHNSFDCSKYIHFIINYLSNNNSFSCPIRLNIVGIIC